MTNDARPAVPTPVNRELCKDATTPVGAGLSYHAWLATLQKRHGVKIRNGRVTFPGMVTNATPCFVFVERLKFRRDNGWQVRRQWRYKLRLRLVRNAEELQ